MSEQNGTIAESRIIDVIGDLVDHLDTLDGSRSDTVRHGVKDQLAAGEIDPAALYDATVDLRNHYASLDAIAESILKLAVAVVKAS